MSAHDQLIPLLKRMRLSGLLQTADLRIEQAVEDRLDHWEFLFRLFNDEAERRDAGLLHRRIKYAAFEGEKTLERTARGLYVLADSDVSAHFGLAEISKRIPGAVISLISALNFHELTTQIPHEVWLSIPRDTWLPGVAAPSELNDSLCRSELLGFQRRTPDASIQAHSKP